MPTADVVRVTALELAKAGIPTEQATRDLLKVCEERRVAVVLARQQLLKDQEPDPEDAVATRAAELLDRVLEQLPME